jgi:hypothetical protein
MSAILPELFPVSDGQAGPRLRQHEPIFARWRRMTRPHGTGSGQMRVIVVIASSTRGFTTPRDGTPTVINPCPSTQDQDEKASVYMCSMEGQMDAL